MVEKLTELFKEQKKVMDEYIVIASKQNEDFPKK